MQFLTLVAYSATVVATVHAAAAGVPASNLKQACGSTAIVGKETIPFNNGTLLATTTACPGFSSVGSNPASHRGLEERQALSATVCTPQGCFIECDTGVAQPLFSDCQVLAQAFESLAPQTFNLPPNTMTTFTLTVTNTCAVTFANIDTIPYTVCYAGVGVESLQVANNCNLNFGLPAATCLFTGAPGNNWFIEVSHS